MPLLWQEKAVREMTRRELEIVSRDVTAPDDVRRQASERLQQMWEQSQKLAELKNEQVRALREKAVRKVPKQRGTIDRISVEHAAKNAGWGGGTVVIGWATIKSITEAYKQVKQSGLAADLWQVVKAVSPSEQAIVYAVCVPVIVFAATLIYKAGRRF